VQSDSKIRNIATAVSFVAVATAVFFPLRSSLDSEQWGWPYLVVVGLAAGTLGIWPAIASALLAFLLWNFLFISPYYTFHVHASGDLTHLMTFLLVATFVGLQTGRLKEISREKDAQSARTTALYRLSSEMAHGATPEAMASSVGREVQAVLGARAARVLDSSPDASSGDGDPPAEGSITIDLRSNTGVEGVLEIREPRWLGPDTLAFAESAAHHMAVALENRRVNQLAVATTAARETERLRTALISSVSHELKTPVASLTASVTDLMTRDTTPERSELNDILHAMDRDLDRLNRSIGNLLEASRLEAQSWIPQPTAFEPGELIGAVVHQFDPKQRSRLCFEVPTGVAAICADFTQVSRALTHLVDNALRYSSGPVTIGARESADGSQVLTWVADSGPGLRSDEQESIFQRFFRGSAGRRSPSSTGLGLSLANEFIIANGGTVTAENLDPHGARFTMRLPMTQRGTDDEERSCR
jgi:two-component system sensor histidine kinase KdpD